MTASELRGIVQTVVEAHATHNTFYSIWTNRERPTEPTFPFVSWEQWRARLQEDEYTGYLFRLIQVQLLIVTTVATDRTALERDQAVEAADIAASDIVLKLREAPYKLEVSGISTTTLYDENTQLDTGVLLTFTVKTDALCLDGDEFNPGDCANGVAVLKDTAGVVLFSTQVPSGSSVDVEAPDGEVTLNGSPYGSVKSGGVLNVVAEGGECEDATAVLKDTEGNTLSTTAIGSGDSEDIVAPDAVVQLKDTAGNDIGAPDGYPSGSVNNKTAPDAAYQLKDSAGTNIGSAGAIRSNASANITAPDGTVVVKNLNNTTLGSPTVRSNASTNYIAPIPMKFGWGAGDADTLTWTVTDDEAGSYATFTQDGGSGTITYSKNGGALSALSGTITLAVGDTVMVRRTITTNAGWSRWAP